MVEVPAFVTAVPGEGRITFEGSDGTRTITSADMRYRVAAAKSLKELQDGIAAGDFKGEKGDTGARGSQGDTDPQGPKGEKGDIGSTGPTGATGSQGPKGETGPQGPKGDKGDIGDTGPQDPVGATGPRGPKGETGPAGKETQVDVTLKISGAAADAKATGDVLAGKAAASHTHNYAGSGSAGGTANSVNGLTFAAQTTDPGAGGSLATNKVLIVYV